MKRRHFFSMIVGAIVASKVELFGESETPPEMVALSNSSLDEIYQKLLAGGAAPAGEGFSFYVSPKAHKQLLNHFAV